MKRFILAAGVAAFAISVPAVAGPGKGQGDKGHDRGGHAMSDRGGGKNADRGGQNRKNFVEQRSKAQDKHFERQARAAEQRSNAREKAFEHSRKMAQDRAHERDKALERRSKMAEKVWQDRSRHVERMADRRELVRSHDWTDWGDLARRGVWVEGCPPGLAKKPVACVPPGQAKKMLGSPLNVLRQQVALRDVPERLRYVYRDTPDYYYRYGDGYMYRVNRSNDVISALLPLFGLGYTAGQAWPSAYSNYYLPSAYQPFYPSSPGYDYRYANGYVYEIDPYTGMIRDVDPMLGYGYGYGQMLPVTYSAYNVPYQYRPLYYDTSDYYYRYAPGAIYQVDPQTSLITAVAALLTNGMTVGQPLPTGYGAYNVPYAYRSTYYDTPNDWYRYSNGYIYRVDPTTQLVTAIVASILT